jgi:hypothetical protein
VWVPTIHKVGLAIDGVFESENFASHVGVLAQSINFKVRLSPSHVKSEWVCVLTPHTECEW